MTTDLPAATGLFDIAEEIILKREGIYSNDARDDGGETWYGLSRNAHPDLPWPPTLEQARAVYRSEYWDGFRCGAFAPPVALALFDAVVQHKFLGAKMLQRALHVAEDGKIGPVTIAAARRRKPGELAATLYAFRVVFIYVPHHDWPDMRVGWMRRLFLNALETKEDFDV